MSAPARTSADVTVVKLGGSLLDDPLLPDWLDALAVAGAGRVVVVPGGGPSAESVRTAQRRWGFDDLAAHNMAVLAMAQTAYQLQALAPSTRLGADDEALRRALALGHTAVWLPFDALRSAPDATTTWATTSDTLALLLATRLGAARLLLVKSCAVDPAAGLDDLAAAGILDSAFTAASASAGCAIGVLDKHALLALEGWLGLADDRSTASPSRPRRWN